MKTIELLKHINSCDFTTLLNWGFICGFGARYYLGSPYNRTNRAQSFVLKATDKNPKKKGWRKIHIDYIQFTSGGDNDGQFTLRKGCSTGRVSLYASLAEFCQPYSGKTVWFKLTEKI